MTGRIQITPDRFGGGEPTVWSASWHPAFDALSDYDGSGPTIELALASLAEHLGEEILSLRAADLEKALTGAGQSYISDKPVSVRLSRDMETGGNT